MSKFFEKKAFERGFEKAAIAGAMIRNPQRLGSSVNSAIKKLYQKPKSSVNNSLTSASDDAVRKAQRKAEYAANGIGTNS